MSSTAARHVHDNGDDEREFIELIGRAQSNDQVAIRLLFTRFHDQLLARIEQQLPHHLECLCWGDDVLAETLVRASQSLKSFEIPKDGHVVQSFLAWLSTIAEHRVIDLIRQEKAQKRPQARLRLDTHADSTSAD